MTYRVRNIGIAVALAVVAAVLTSFYVSNYRQSVRRDETNVQVYVAKRDIAAGTEASEIAAKGLIGKSEIVRRSVVPGAISSPKQLNDLVASQPIYAGEQVSTRRFATPAQRGLHAQLTGTMRAFQVPGDQHQLLAGTLRTADRVDVVASIKIDPDKDIHATRIILRDIEVLKPAAVGGAESQLTRSTGLSILLAVTDTQVQKLFHVMKHGEWSLELRPPIKSNDSPETVAYVGSIMRDGLRGTQLEQLQGGATR